MDVDSLNLSYNAALIFGAITIIFRSWENFNRPTAVQRDSLGDLVTLLTPSDMRAQRVYWRAFFFYAAILVVVYVVICSYANFFVPLLGEQFSSLVQDSITAPPVGAETLQVTGYDPDMGEKPPEDTRSPALPLALSLAMVGLAPQIEALRRFETRLRYLSHWLSGIPTRLVKGAELLEKHPLGLKDLLASDAGTRDGVDNPAAVAREDWQRLAHYAQRFRDRDIPIDTFQLSDHAERIIAFRSWILKGRLDIRNSYTDYKAQAVEEEVTRQADRFLAELDRATGFAINGRSDGKAPPIDAAMWNRLDEEAAALSRKISIVAMLLVEHGVIQVDEDSEPELRSFPETVQKDQNEQRQIATAFLRDRLTIARNQSDWGELSFSVWGRTMLSILLLAVLAGAVSGVLQLRTLDRSDTQVSLGILQSTIDYATNAFVIYALPLFAAFSIRQNRALNRQWHNPFRQPWIRWHFQFVEIVIVTVVVAIFCAVSQGFAETIGRVGIERVVDNWWPVLRGALEYGGVLSLVGPTLAVALVLVIDAWDAAHTTEDLAQKEDEALTRARMNTVILYGCTLAVGLVALVTRITASYIGEMADIRNGFQTALPPLPELLAERWQIYASSTFFALLIGFVAGLTVRETLTKEFKAGAVRRIGLTRSRGGSAKAPAE